MPAIVPRHELRAGPLLAEGGEGRVYELVDKPGVLYKSYRRHPPADPLLSLVAWRDGLATTFPELARRVDAASAWPTAVVTEPGASPGTAAGLLMPRAPRRFSVRHRDGQVRLASLSYLTTDPAQRAAAYGLALPAPFSTERIGIVYALARLLEAFQAADPSVGHGDLSAKNVLWSLERGPEVFVLDCDSCERYRTAGSAGSDGTAGSAGSDGTAGSAGADGIAAVGGPDSTACDAEHRRRAMTPNWDDPAIPPGANPTLASDRYSLALIFLRVAGAAHFPVQSRQRRGEILAIDFGVPPSGRRARSLAADAPVWDLCARSLSAAAPHNRPGAGAWVGALEQILDDLGAMGTVRAVWAAQGGGTPAPSPARPEADPVVDVTVRPVAVVRGGRSDVRRRPAPAPLAGEPWRGRGSTQAPAPTPSPVAVRQSTGWQELRAEARRAARAWLDFHRAMLRALASPGRRRRGVARLVACLMLDFVMLVAVAFGCAMLVSPWLGI